LKLSLETIRTTQEVFQIDDKLTRRQFIQDSAAAGDAIGAGIVLSNSTHASSTGKILNYNSDMEYRRCGRTGLMISAICLGGHGQSFAHRNDENNTTPPEKMYSADKIDFFCQGCHNSHDVPPGKVAALWAKRNPDKTDPDKIVCTDCHGEHRMKVRTIIWDKKTGKLLRTNRGK